MIETGWIFSDGTEYPCGVDGFTVHDLVVIQFIKGLKLLEPETYAIIKKEIDDLWDRQGSRNLYANYAINRLGWIKVGTSIWHNIIYAGYDWQSDLVKPYVENNYIPQNKCLSSNSYLTLNLDVQLTLRKGGTNFTFF